MKKVFCIILFCLFSIYPPAELTRYILAYEKAYGSAPAFKFELLSIWIWYIIAMILFNLILWTRWEDD